MPSDPSVPPSAAVPHNRWPDLAVAAAETLEPTATVSVVIPCRDDTANLERTVAALNTQTYPSHLVEILIVDDGSDPAIDGQALEELVGRLAPDWAGSLSVLAQERFGFGAGRARNLGASQSHGEILLFLDADILLERDGLAQHARWHHAARDVVVLGVYRAVDVDGIDAAAVAAAEEIGALLTGREVTEPAWLTSFIERRKQLTGRHRDLFAAMTGCNVSLRRDLYDDVGGFTFFGLRGIEDTELAWRLFTAGAVFVPEPGATGWHQGARHFDGEEKDATKRRRTPLLQHAIPASTVRPTAARRFDVAKAVITIDVTDVPYDAVLTAVDAALASSVRDVAVHLDGLPEHPDADLLRETFGPDGRVTGLDGEPAARFCEIRITAPATVPLAPDTVAVLLDTLAQRRVGLVRVGHADTGVRAVTARAAERAVRVAADRDEAQIHTVIEELFGAWDLPEDAAGLAAPEPAEDSMPVAALQAVQDAQQAAAAAQAEAERLSAELDEVRAQLDRARQRRAVRLADKAGRLFGRGG